ncbi:hypothetical protein QLS71_006820 [Mariniflexile litorale]|uniref:Capsule polysaccharide biosynthesis protein n=1 Tax=Mariniflexile litorale TaxID=3045158 RepID=A0AAU7EJN5_9FLAO|nr:hypothetical protein [Mariniflexile sp. KMM 9835]MDQ8211340.1 hypothetical protein [Mariniflexile sp. KMM 9835]
MNILILINQAPNYGYTYTKIGKRLKKQGHKITYALDSTLTFWDYKDCFDKDDEILIFSDYFKKYPNNIEIKSKELYNKNLWMLFFSDFERINMYGLHKAKGVEYFKSVIANLLNFFEEIFSTKQIHTILYEGITNFFAYSAYTIGQKYQVNYFGITATALPNRFCVEPNPFYDSKSIMDNYYKITKGELQVDEKDKKWVDGYYNNFIAIEPDYMKNERKLLNISLFSKYFNTSKVFQILSLLKYFLTYGINENRYNFQNPALKINLAYFKRNIRRKIRLGRINSLYSIKDIEEINTNGKYLIYPIHFHPESSTSVLAPQHIDEYYNILNIAIQLPYCYTLLVKEHPSAVGFSEIDFYKKIKAIPNVKLVHHNVKAKQLIKLSKGVITITNTMGYESLIMGKKTFLLGRVFYETHPNCVVLNGFNQLFDKITTEIDKIDSIDPKKYIQAYLLYTHKGTAVYEKKVNDNFVNEISQLIVRRFES